MLECRLEPKPGARPGARKQAYRRGELALHIVERALTGPIEIGPVQSQGMSMSGLYVYILANSSRALYVGVSRSLVRRVDQHQNGPGHSYVRRHRIDRLVYFERISPPIDAIRREKQIKSWSRMKRVDLVESVNPGWEDLSKLTMTRGIS